MWAGGLARRLAPSLRSHSRIVRTFRTELSPRPEYHDRRWGSQYSPISYALPVGLATVLAWRVTRNASVEAEATKQATVPLPEPQDLVNWSGTHTVHTRRYYTPETVEELQQIVQHAHESRQKLRPVGSALSPNGLPFEPAGMVNLTNMDKVLSVDVANNTVTVQAGATISGLVDNLRPHGLTLPNFASITEQQVGGLTQVGAHGTGARIPPMDEAVIGLKLITPAAGMLELSAHDEDPSLFQLARTSLGMIGVVAEVTLQCVPVHKLVERVSVLSRDEVMNRHHDFIRENKHLRYMWIPHTDSVVVVTCNPHKGEELSGVSKFTMDERLEAARNLLKTHPRCKLAEEQIRELSFTSLRDELLALDPVSVSWVKQVNQAEQAFWQKSEGIRIDWSDKILQFDCGGQQWVSEIAFPVKKGEKTDVKYVNSLLDLVEKEKVAAPAPIEQRWSAPSMSPMSPAAEKPERPLPEMYAWVGIIMYLPESEDEKARERITMAFKAYKGLCERKLWPDFRAVEHWAKIEMPQDDVEKSLLQLRTHQKYPVDAFKAICRLFDPHGILRNDLMDTILGAEVATK